MIRIKICGITDPNDATSAVNAGADAIGMNFYSGSPRCVTPDAARTIAASVPAAISKVGVFVNSPSQQVLDVARAVPLDFIQLHGDEPAELLAELASVPVIRAWRVRDEKSLEELFGYLERCRELGREPAALLIDAFQAGQYGGTGENVPWDLLVRRPEPLEDKSVILAGGLRPDNVSRAIHTVRPDGVDVSSGVEQRPGKKDELLVRQFIEQAVAAFAAVTAG